MDCVSTKSAGFTVMVTFELRRLLKTLDVNQKIPFHERNLYNSMGAFRFRSLLFHSWKPFPKLLYEPVQTFSSRKRPVRAHPNTCPDSAMESSDLQLPGRCSSRAGCASHRNASPGPDTGTRAAHRADQAAYPAGASTVAPDSHATSSARPVSGYPGSPHVRRFPRVTCAREGPAADLTRGEEFVEEAFTFSHHVTEAL